MSATLVVLIVATCVALAALKVADLFIARSMRRSARRMEDATASLLRALERAER